MRVIEQVTQIFMQFSSFRFQMDRRSISREWEGTSSPPRNGDRPDIYAGYDAPPPTRGKPRIGFDLGREAR